MSQNHGRIKTIVDYSDYLSSTGYCCEITGERTIKTMTSCFASSGYFIPLEAGEGVECPDLGPVGCCCACAYTTKNTGTEEDWLNKDSGDPFYGIRGKTNGLRENTSQCACQKVGGNWTPGDCPTDPLEIISMCQNLEPDALRNDVRIPYACCHCELDENNEYIRVCGNVCNSSECANLNVPGQNNCTSTLIADAVCDQDYGDIANSQIYEYECPQDDSGTAEPVESCYVCRIVYDTYNTNTEQVVLTNALAIDFCSPTAEGCDALLNVPEVQELPYPDYPPLLGINPRLTVFSPGQALPETIALTYAGLVCGDTENSQDTGCCERAPGETKYDEDAARLSLGSRCVPSTDNGCPDYSCTSGFAPPGRQAESNLEDVSACCVEGGCIYESRDACERLNGFFVEPTNNEPIRCSSSPCPTKSKGYNSASISASELPEVGSVFGGGIYMGIFNPVSSKVLTNLDTGKTTIERFSDPRGIGKVASWALIMCFTDLGSEFDDLNILYRHTSVSDIVKDPATSTYDGNLNTYGDGKRIKAPETNLLNQIRQYNRFSMHDWYLPSIQELGFAITAQGNMTLAQREKRFSKNYIKMNSMVREDASGLFTYQFLPYLSSTRKRMNFAGRDNILKKYPASHLVYNSLVIPQTIKDEEIKEKNGFTSLTGLDTLHKVRLFRRILIQ